METVSLFACSKCYSLPSRHSRIRVKAFLPKNWPPCSPISDCRRRTSLRISAFSYVIPPPPRWLSKMLPPSKTWDCSTATSKTETGFSIAYLGEFVSGLTPIGVCKWVAIAYLSLRIIKWALCGLVMNPVLWVYLSHALCFWPLFLSVAVGVYGLYCLRRHLRGEANIFEQMGVVSCLFFWLTLVPPAYANGFLEGWPFVFFFVYHCFFFLEASIRYHYFHTEMEEPRRREPKWDSVLPNRHAFMLFCAGVLMVHWLAAFEGPPPHMILPCGGGWTDALIWVLIIHNLFTHFQASSFVHKYLDNGAPINVVQFGPYRWIRHPIYASVMFLFVTYFMALRAPFSCFLVVVICLWYYDQKARLEERLLVETFGKTYEDYQKKGFGFRLIGAHTRFGTSVCSLVFEALLEYVSWRSASS